MGISFWGGWMGKEHWHLRECRTLLGILAQAWRKSGLLLFVNLGEPW